MNFVNPFDLSRLFKNKGDQSLARIADINTVKEYVDTKDPQETIIDITSEQILNMGSSPIELLPAAGVNNYYDINEIFLEYTYNGTPYTLPDKTSLTVNGYRAFSVIDPILTNGSSNVYIIKEFSFPTSSIAPGVQELTPSRHNLNDNCELVISGSANPTNGNGTLRVIIRYKVRTFGE